MGADFSPVTRLFSGYQQPLLEWVADQLLDRQGDQPFIDLSSVIVAVPGGNALRRLMVLLVLGSEKRGKGLVPPEILTRGALIDRFLPRNVNLASEISRQMAWLSAVRETDIDTLKALIPEADERYLENSGPALARRIDSLYVEISGTGLTFGDVAEKGQQMAGFLDEERWEVLHQLYLSYLETLAGQGLSCRYARRLEFLGDEHAVTLDMDLFLVGLFELNGQQRQFLDRCQGKVTAFVFADPAQKDGFDRYGAVIPAVWEHHTVPLKNSQIEVVEHPRDVATAALEWVKQVALEFSQQDFVFGVGNEQQLSYLRGQFDELDFPTRAASGLPALETEAGFLLVAVSRYLASRTYQDLAALIRHPYISAWLSQKLGEGNESIAAVLSPVDFYQVEHLQSVMSEALPVEFKTDPEAVQRIELLHVLLKPLLEMPAPAAEWAARLHQVVEPFAGSIGAAHPDVLELMNELIEELAACPSSESLRAVDVLGLVLNQLQTRAQIPDARESGVELMGWLELAFDDAAALMLTGLEEGVVPAVINADPFLPDSLRRHLGLAHNSSRLARDLCLLTALMRSKQQVRVIVARRSLQGNTVLPSRLLSACDDNDLPERIDLLYQEGSRFVREGKEGAQPRDFLLKPPLPLETPVDRMSVTSFAAYLACPYRFYLERVVGIRSLDDDQLELDALKFGNLAHDVLGESTKDPAFNSTDAEVIFRLLDGALTTAYRHRFGKHPLPAVRVQVEQLRERLRLFSRWQALHRRQGWITVAHERDLKDLMLALKLPDGEMAVSGRIDRIDFHEASGKYLVIDYKTGEKGREKKDICFERKVENSKQKEIVWADMQVPLYLLAGRKLFPEAASIEFAYINISAQLDGDIYTEIQVTNEEYDAGIAQAHEIARLVQAQVFWPPTQAKARSRQQDPYWMLFAGLSDELEQTQEEFDV